MLSVSYGQTDVRIGSVVCNIVGQQLERSFEGRKEEKLAKHEFSSLITVSCALESRISIKSGCPRPRTVKRLLPFDPPHRNWSRSMWTGPWSPKNGHNARKRARAPRGQATVTPERTKKMDSGFCRPRTHKWLFPFDPRDQN